MSIGALISIGVSLLCFLSWALAFAQRSAPRHVPKPPQFAEYETLRAPRVIDGDTIHDRATGVRYRFANIDAPETGDNAKCFRERELGDRAKRVAMHFVQKASSVTVRNTFEIDRYNRRIADVYVDGINLGEKLVAYGLAAPWVGYRKRWCGRFGQLAHLATVRNEHFACKTCRDWQA